MTLVSTTAQNASLDNDYGATKGPNAAASHLVHLYVGDPAAGGTELTTAGGYAAPTLPNDGTGWPNASAGGAKTSASVSFPTSTGAWSGIPTHYLLTDANTGTEWDSGPLAGQPSVDSAGVVVSLPVTVFYNSSF